MALSRIDEVYIYTNSAEDPIGTHELHAWFDHSGIKHIKLDYKDPVQNVELLAAINTWWVSYDLATGETTTLPPITTFPFVVYTEVHSDAPVSYLPRKYIVGKENIIAQLPGLYALGRD